MDIYPAELVVSKAGRDVEKYFAVLEIVDENYVLICDGKMRSIDNPKKKKLKHIEKLDYSLDRIKEKIELGKKISNSDIRKSIKAALIDLGISCNE